MDRDTQTVVVVRGEGGLLEGERRELKPGGTLVVGRSRSCHVSLRRTPRFESHTRQRQILCSRPFLRVSRVHCEIAHLPDGCIEVRDLSANGTLVDGERIKRLIRVSPRESEIRVELCDPRHGRLLIQTGARQAVPATA